VGLVRSVVDFLPDERDRAGSPARSTRVVWLGLVLLNALMILVCGALLEASRRADLANARTEALNDVRLAEKAAGAIFDKASIALGAVVAQVQRQLVSGGLDTSTFWALVDAQATQVSEVDRIGVFDAQGAQFCGVPAARCQNLVVADRDYFQRLRDHPDDPVRLYGPVPSRTDGRPALLLARALRLTDGRFAGVAVAVLPMERLRPLVAAANLGPGGSVSLRTAELVTILRQPEFTGPDADAAARRISDTLRSAIVASPVEGVYTAVIPSDGIERLAVYRRLERYPLYWFEGRAIDDILADWRIQVAWTTAFLLIFAGVSVLLARATTTSLRRQAQALKLYDDAPCGYHTLGPDGTYLSINATELQWLGCTRDEVVGKLKPTDFFTDAGRATFAANFPALARTGRLEGLELELVGRNGTNRHVLVNASAFRDAKGKFLRGNSVMHDISALHDARRALSALAAQQGVMLDNELIGMVRAKDRRTRWKNQAMDRIFGYSGAEWEDLPARTLYFDEESYERAGVEIREAMDQGRACRIQVPMRHKDGRKLWIDVYGVLLSPDTGELLMMLSDITPLKSAEEARVRAAELEAQNFQLREMSRLKNEFVANLSHELRTPLNAVLGFGQMLESGAVKPDSPKYVSYIGRIVGSGKHLLGLIDQVLDFAKVESGKMAFESVPIGVPHALHEVVELLSADSAPRHIAVHVDVDEGIETVFGDPVRLRQMLIALVGNAIKFSHHDGRVEIRASTVDDALWQVEVTDHGIGIEPASLPRLFAPFVQLSSGSTKTHGGTGIGLALVRLIAVAQGGRVDVRSELGQGSTFTLVLPRHLSN